MAEAPAGPARIQLDDVRETVTCGICLQLFTDPRGLNCSHTYCLVCLKGFQKSSSKKECPVCRAKTIPSKHELDNLPVNKLATELVKLVHSYEPSTVGKCCIFRLDYWLPALCFSMAIFKIRGNVDYF